MNVVAKSAAARDAERDSRIVRMQRRYQSGPAYISIERARYYTESWRQTEGRPLPVRVAEAMRCVYTNMTHYVDPDDRIAGYWTEHFLGAPIDIERGVYNGVLESELTHAAMVRSRVSSLAGGLAYLVRKRALGNFVRNQRIVRASGKAPLHMGLQTMSEREINQWQLAPAARKELLGELLPFWKGETLVDRIGPALARAGLVSPDMQEFATALTGGTSRQVSILSACTSISTIQGHVILDYDKVLERGLDGMRDEILRARAADTSLTTTQRDFLVALQIAVEGVMLFAARLAEQVAVERDRTRDPEHKRILSELHERCAHAPLHPPRTFAEAVQALWTVKTAVELAHPMNLHCFGRLDQILAPYYERDLADGRITPDEACTLLEELLLKIMSQNVRLESGLLTDYYHRFLGSSPVTIGGRRPDGADGTNALTSLFLRAAHRSRAITNVSLRVNPDTPDAILHEVATYLADGTSSFSLYNDDLTIDAMRRRGFDETDARDFAIMGCVEATCPGRTGSMSASALQLARLLDITLRNGDAALMAWSIPGEGLHTGDPDRFETFDELLDAFCEQAAHFLDRMVEGSNLKDRIYAEHLPAPHISAFMQGCFESATDVTQGGARYDLAGISMLNSIANAVDSLYVLRELVYEQRRFTVAELLAAIDANFVGHERVLDAIGALRGKWGNGDPKVDALAHRVAKGLFAKTYTYRTPQGGPFVVYLISMITHTIDGRLSIATPDGRRAATPFAASCNPYNVERSGITAAMRSVAALPFEDVMGAAVNMKFHPSAVGATPETRSKWIGLLRTYFTLGGAQLQPSAVSTRTLRAAQLRPQEHQDLIVKVGGYSTYFVDLGPEIQDEIIARTEHA